MHDFLGPTRIYENLCPLFSGLGISNFYVSSMVSLYYNMIVAWTIFYTCASFTSELPWSKCGQVRLLTTLSGALKAILLLGFWALFIFFTSPGPN